MVLAGATTLAGCGRGQVGGDGQDVPAAHYDRYPIKVAHAPIKLEISSQHGSLQPSQINAIAGFARSAKSSSASRIMIRRPSSGGASRQVASQAYQLLVQSGVSPGMIATGTYPGPATGPVQLSYMSTVVVTRVWGDWLGNIATPASSGT